MTHGLGVGGSYLHEWWTNASASVAKMIATWSRASIHLGTGCVHFVISRTTSDQWTPP